MSQSTTIVVPVYNEARRLKPDAFLAALDQMQDLSFCFVDDGSRDETPERLALLATTGGGRIRVHRLPSNVGKGEAVRRGLLAALEVPGRFVGYWDADLATPLSELPTFMEALVKNPEIHVVLGSRVRLLGRHIERRSTRHYLGRIFATAASTVLRMPVYDTQCGAKLFRRSDELANCLVRPFRSRWIFDVELLARLDASCGSRLVDHALELPVREWADVGSSRLRASDWVRAPWELLLVAWGRHRLRSRGEASEARRASTTGEAP